MPASKKYATIAIKDGEVMTFMKIITDIPILVVLLVFITSTIYCYSKYLVTGRNLKIFIEFISLCFCNMVRI